MAGGGVDAAGSGMSGTTRLVRSSARVFDLSDATGMLTGSCGALVRSAWVICIMRRRTNMSRQWHEQAWGRNERASRERQSSGIRFTLAHLLGCWWSRDGLRGLLIFAGGVRLTCAKMHARLQGHHFRRRQAPCLGIRRRRQRLRRSWRAGCVRTAWVVDVERRGEVAGRKRARDQCALKCALVGRLAFIDIF